MQTKKTSLKTNTYPVVMTIAGSDCSGGAGIQADLRTFNYFKVFASSVITVVTAQNDSKFYDAFELDSDIILQQLRAIKEKFSIKAIKIGMLYSEKTIKILCKEFETWTNCPLLLIDPMMISSSGSKLLQNNAIDVLKNELLPKAWLITPNIPEAQELSGISIDSLKKQKEVAEKLGKENNSNILLKGGHASTSGNEIYDVLYYNGKIKVFVSEKIKAPLSSHGTGCSLISAITACIANNIELIVAVERAIKYVNNSLKNCIKVGKHSYTMYPYSTL